MGKVDWTREAERWLRDIHDYIAGEDPKAAIKTVRGILAKAQMLTAFPELGQRYPRHTDKNIRVLRYGHYRIAYLVKDRENIDILGVFHERLDISRFVDE